MSAVYAVIALLLLLTVVASLFRVLRGPTPADRMLAAQLFTTTGVAVLLVLAELQRAPAARDVALVFALLAVLATVAFVRRVWGESEREDGE